MSVRVLLKLATGECVASAELARVPVAGEFVCETTPGDESPTPDARKDARVFVVERVLLVSGRIQWSYWDHEAVLVVRETTGWPL